MRSQNIAPRSAPQIVSGSLTTLLVASSAPYGYTLAIWSSGAVLLRSHGVPHIAEVFVFVAGAIGGFNLMGLLVQQMMDIKTPVSRPGDRLLAGLLDWIAVGAAVGAVSLLAEIHGWLPWLLAPFVATVLYLLVASLQLAAIVLRGLRSRSSADRPRK